MTTAEYGVDLLAFGPHPDDVELFCGGLLASMQAKGYRIGVVDLTRGELSSRGTPATRAAETEAASAVLGLAFRDQLGLADTGLAPWSDAQLLPIVASLRRHRPEIVVAPWERERHPDHEAASALVARAVFLAGVRNFATDPQLPAFTPRTVLYYPMRHLGEPSVIIDTSAVAERKLAAVRCYASQVQADPDAPPTLVGSPLSLESIDARDRFYGAQIGAAHGEPYIVRHAIGLADPIDHFRRNAWAPPLFFPER
jgi:bacillithiol biosynthesis deacetylase BshB1